VIVAAPPYDAQHFVTVEETVTLTLRDLKPHTFATVAFDLYLLKSWDGNNRTYGPDRWRLRVQDGPALLDTTFSNNPKTGADLSQQNYPAANSPRQSGAASVNTLGYTFYGDSIYHFSFNFPHAAGTLVLNFSSSLFEGKGTEDESWGLDNVRVSSNSEAPFGASAAAPSVGLAAQAFGSISFGSIYGMGLATAPAASRGQPWPAILGGVTPGDVPRNVLTGSGSTLNFVAKVAAIAPGLFTANGDGQGVVAHPRSASVQGPRCKSRCPCSAAAIWLGAAQACRSNSAWTRRRTWRVCHWDPRQPARER
jgi:hypothetical protein